MGLTSLPCHKAKFHTITLFKLKSLVTGDVEHGSKSMTPTCLVTRMDNHGKGISAYHFSSTLHWPEHGQKSIATTSAYHLGKFQGPIDYAPTQMLMAFSNPF